MGQSYKMFFTFMCPTNKAPSTDMIYPVPYWVHNSDINNLAVFLIVPDMCKLKYCDCFSSWCNSFIELYYLSIGSLSVVSANYKVN